MSKTGIIWSLFIIILVAAAGIVGIEVYALRTGGWTISKRVLELYHEHPWWIVPVLAAFVFGCALIAGHVVQLFGAYLPRTGVTQDVATLSVLLLAAVSGLVWGARIWPQ